MPGWPRRAVAISDGNSSSACCAAREGSDKHKDGRNTERKGEGRERRWEEERGRKGRRGGRGGDKLRLGSLFGH